MSEHDDHDAGGSSSSGPSSQGVGGYIRVPREVAQLSLRQLARQAGVSNPYLSQIERGLRKPSAEILQAISRALGLPAETLYVKAGILEEREHGDAETVIARDPHLTESQRQALIEAYRSFRRITALLRSDTAAAEGGEKGSRPAVPGALRIDLPDAPATGDPD